ncbi:MULTISPECIES: glutathione S-transferase family protein [Bradyrhizobium]|jgi:glutathione S-transferase|uniref:Glutathione S-transferase family protein n=2 Tax=Bradyrhizobium TaxID=374 RepID=A0ABS5GBK0_9BRAD|nr:MULTISPECIES: glutathione S-transferase family protein [Bradyrhizobium]MBR1138709.1 glutathione S-transferase family protein [Bradyrhizobium denitrificans]MDU1495482.1 glutathione S-transferase family protein [Bradyrhizobium sp.]MDU1545712.1 glutathione S-transferase family protein [Bradyrhizobium sp.]MDU1804421.1 glutathione S-transferase family protein [Bradyrhizobium sp.]MDU2924645.1 glutathione S-transferase family protein [Bradyrhizobium sp.]
MKIYWIKAQAPRRVLALVKHLGAPAEFIDISRGLKTPDFAALNPNMKAPVLVDGETVLWESTAIMAHLCVRESCDMWPARHPQEQVEVLRWLAWTDSHWSPAVAPFYFEHIVRKNFGLGAPNRAALIDKVADLKTFASVLDAHLRSHSHVACDRLTIADFAAASMATDWREAEMPFETFPNIVRWLDGLMRLPAWAEPWPDMRSAAA